MQAAAQRTSGMVERHYRWARAYRGGQLVCGRVDVRIGCDSDRVRLATGERRFVVVRFLDELDPALRRELAALVTRRGAAAKRIAERLAPITLVIDGAGDEQMQVVGHLQPPHRRFGELHDVEFAIRELKAWPAP